MAKRPSLTEQYEEMQRLKHKLGCYEKVVNHACIIHFNCSAKTIQEILTRDKVQGYYLEQDIKKHFKLKTQKDIEEFVYIMCSEDVVEFFNNERKRIRGY